MQLTDQELQEFIAICREAFDRNLAPDEARGIAMRYLHLLEVLARPLPSPRTLAAKKQPEYGDSNPTPAGISPVKP